jgi:hypothetical protein
VFKLLNRILVQFQWRRCDHPDAHLLGPAQGGPQGDAHLLSGEGRQAPGDLRRMGGPQGVPGREWVELVARGGQVLAFRRGEPLAGPAAGSVSGMLTEPPTGLGTRSDSEGLPGRPPESRGTDGTGVRLTAIGPPAGRRRSGARWAPWRSQRQLQARAVDARERGGPPTAVRAEMGEICFGRPRGSC